MAAEYLGIVELGGLYKNGVVQNRPTKPWRIDSEPVSGVGVGDIPDFTTLADMTKWTIGNTPGNAAQRLKWHKIKDGSKTLLISDRVILARVSWDDLNGQSLVTGKTITIDGQQYLCRLLTGGSDRRNGDYYAGGSPSANEWDRFITREEAISGLPVPTSTDLDTTLNTTDQSSTHNQTWNWFGMYSWVQETYTGNSSSRAIRGYYSARYWDYNTSSGRLDYLGWRPVLEVLNTAPLISDSDRNLGNKNANFSVTYQVNDTDAGDVLTVTEKLDGNVIRTISPAQRQYDYTINININSVSLGSHTITIEVNDGKGASATRTFTFTRVNAAPTITGTDQNLGDKNRGFQITYRVNDADGDSLTVTEKLNGNILRTLNNPPKNQDITLEITDQQLFALLLNSTNTIVIEAKDPAGATAYRTYTFRRTNTAPLISGADENLGLVTGPFSRDYSVTDAEGDTVVIQEKIDGNLIRSIVATLGDTYTVDLPQDVWFTLANGHHALTVEATDANAATSVRTFGFEKNETTIRFELQHPFETDARATKILVTPIWEVEGAEVAVYACNNAFDENPTWEDITAQVFINRVFNFINTTKTADKWGVNIRFEISKYPEYTGTVSIRGFGGAYE
ncbi:hypothetical protein POTG_01727 [Paenibacillus sp. oral taxon 786 str. D14]|uniref:Ig-like domain-containing protein n=1 Tax=Paenibacillus sp. oral taxon 786 TaxID=652715 RepID=UPI0001AFD272|nr:hypothetical protein [Paenibacillus sp. oral taxon 786]EES73432.1 hypothetical protein POTG_01727 [Paenibacillus sp. oral taxon 786 str. D14]